MSAAVLEAWALAALNVMPVYKEDVGSTEKPAQYAMIAKAVTQAALEQRGWGGSVKELIAYQLAVVENETHASLRIHRNECNLKKRECDAGRAISLFQLHAKPLSSPDVWPKLGFATFESTLLSAKEASRVLVRSRGACSRMEGDKVAMVFTAYAGRGCQTDRWLGWKPRKASYERFLRVPMPRVQVASGESQKAAG